MASGGFKIASDAGAHGLAEIARDLVRKPRTRHWAIVEIHNASTRIDHPDDEPDEYQVTVRIASLEVITDPAERDQVEAMAKRARSARSGQATLDEVV